VASRGPTDRHQATASRSGIMTERTGEELTSSDLGTLELWVIRTVTARHPLCITRRFSDPLVVRSCRSWENAYAQELDNFHDHGDVGEIWFGAGNTRKVVR